MASSGEESASDAQYGPATTMRKRRCLRRRMHHQAMRRSTSTEKNPTDIPYNWPFWWLGAAAIVIFVTPGLSILNPTRSMHEKAMDALWTYGEEQRWWMESRREDKMLCNPNYDDEHFFDAFKKPCPQGVRYRDDATLHRIAMQQLHAYPVMVQERPRPDMVEQGGGGGESSGGGSRMRTDPTLEDIDLIDVLWREDIEREKSGGAAVAPGVGVHPSDQVERDLQLLTEKSVQAPLTLEESTRYEDLSKCYFEDFYSNRRFAGEFSTSGKSIRRGGSVSAGSSSSSSSCSPTSSSSTRGAPLDGAFSTTASSSTTVTTSSHRRRAHTDSSSAEEEEAAKPRTPIPSDADVDALFEDLGKECGELNMLMPTEGAGMGCPIPTGGAATTLATPTSQPVQQQQQPTIGYTGPMPTADTLLQNVSLSTIAPYNPANLTELDFMVRDGTLSSAASQMVLPPIVGSLSAPNGTNGFPEPTQFWFESAPDGTASYQSRQPVLNMSTLQLPPLLGLNSSGAVDVQLDLQQAAAAAAAAAAASAAASEDINMPPAHHELTTLTGRMPVYETRPGGARTASMSSTNETQSLGAASSSSSSSSSPRYSSTSTQGGAGSDGENRSPRSRFYGKLAPMPRVSASSISLYDDDEEDGDAAGFFRSPSHGGASLHAHSGGLNSAVAPRRRGRQSKDEQLAASNGLPVSAAEIADMSLPELQKLLKADSLTEPQRQLIRKIRRRGKNKVAARTCRQRRGAARTDHSSVHDNLRVLGYSNHH